MKTLTLIRHATANNRQISQADSERSLSEIGRLEARNIAQQLQKRGGLPDYLLCSPTKRTRQTAAILCQTLHLSSRIIHVDDILYSGDLEAILSCLQGLKMAQQLFVIGHNPNISHLAHCLCKASQGIMLPPAGVICLEFSTISWNTLSQVLGRLLFFTEPDHALC